MGAEEREYAKLFSNPEIYIEQHGHYATLKVGIRAAFANTYDISDVRAEFYMESDNLGLDHYLECIVASRTLKQYAQIIRNFQLNHLNENQFYLALPHLLGEALNLNAVAYGLSQLALSSILGDSEMYMSLTQIVENTIYGTLDWKSYYRGINPDGTDYTDGIDDKIEEIANLLESLAEKWLNLGDDGELDPDDRQNISSDIDDILYKIEYLIGFLTQYPVSGSETGQGGFGYSMMRIYHCGSQVPNWAKTGWETVRHLLWWEKDIDELHCLAYVGTVDQNKSLLYSILNVLDQSRPTDGGIDRTGPETFITDGPSGTITTNDVTFAFTGSDDVSPTSSLVYAYGLEGYDTDWSDYTSSTSKTYIGLPNGSYTFYVKAKDSAIEVHPYHDLLQ